MTYRLDGLPEDFTATFAPGTGAELRLWLHMGNWPPPPPLVRQAKVSPPG